MSTVIGVVVLLVVLAAFVAVGLRARRAEGDVEDYLVARNTQPAATLGLSFFAAGVGAWVLFVPPEVGAFVGLAGALGYGVAAAVPLLLFGLLGPRLRRAVPHGHSLSELVRVRFGPVVHGWVVAVSMGYMLLFVASELTAAAAAGAILAGLPTWLTVLGVATATLAYTAAGGLRASLVTDRAQGALVIALVALAVLAVALVVPDSPQRLADSGLLAIDAGGLEVALTLVIAVTAANAFHQGYWQRVWAARDDRALGRGAALGITLTLPVIVVLGLLGRLAVGAGLDLGEPAAPLFALLAELPSWTVALALVGVVALVCSSVDTLETGLASLVTAERRDTSVRAAQVAVVVLMLPAIAIALQGYSVVRIFLLADLLCTTVLVPALAVLWSRATPAGALAGTAAGLVGAFLPGLFGAGSLGDRLAVATFPGGAPTLAPFLSALVASTLVTVAVSLAGGARTDVVAAGSAVGALDDRPRAEADTP